MEIIDDPFLERSKKEIQEALQRALYLERNEREDKGGSRRKKLRARLSKEATEILTTQQVAITKFLIRTTIYDQADDFFFTLVGEGSFFKDMPEECKINGWYYASYLKKCTLNNLIAEYVYRYIRNGADLQSHIERMIKNMSNEYGEFIEEVENTKEATPEEMKQKVLQEQINELRKMLSEEPKLGEQIDADEVQKQLEDKLGVSLDSEGNLKVESKVPMQGGAAQKNESDVEYLIRRFREFREYLAKGEGPRDVVSNATYKNAGKMLAVGIPKEAIVHAYAMTWPEKVRAELEIAPYDVQEFGECKSGQHRAVPYVEALVKAGVPAMLVGPTQAGKGYLSRNIAENRELQYGSVPLSAGTSISWLFGRNMPKGFVSTDLVRCYENGGVFLLDEMDAADANLLIGINDALSNDELANPVIDQRIKKHEDFIPIAAANTFGLGADADYTGRERLDMATLERWRMGRVEVEYDRDLQVEILKTEADK